MFDPSHCFNIDLLFFPVRRHESYAREGLKERDMRNNCAKTGKALLSWFYLCKQSGERLICLGRGRDDCF